MKTWLKAVCGIVLSFITCFMTFGYAALSDTMSVMGNVTVRAQSGVFIREVIIAENVNATSNYCSGTVLNSTVNLGEDGNATLSFDISLYNNSPYVYQFNGVHYLEETYDNENILFELTDLVKGDKIEGQQSLDFTITFFYEVPAGISNTILNSVLNFEFVPEEEYIPEIAVNDALGKFKQILNEPADYQALIDQMDDDSGRANDTYIGNVVGATTTDTVLLESLFTEGNKNYLTLTINGKDTNVTAMIKRENLDGKTTTGDENGNEMTIYLTADEIGRNSVQVFVGVFTKEDGGAWTQLGELYEGTASTNNYAGSWFGSRNSFNTDTWRSAVNYYNLGTRQYISTIISAYLKT